MSTYFARSSSTSGSPTRQPEGAVSAPRLRDMIG
jgi:hypothetical protein